MMLTYHRNSTCKMFPMPRYIYETVQRKGPAREVRKELAGVKWVKQGRPNTKARCQEGTWRGETPPEGRRARTETEEGQEGSQFRKGNSRV